MASSSTAAGSVGDDGVCRALPAGDRKEGGHDGRVFVSAGEVILSNEEAVQDGGVGFVGCDKGDVACDIERMGDDNKEASNLRVDEFGAWD